MELRGTLTTKDTKEHKKRRGGELNFDDQKNRFVFTETYDC
jgi:hypothetical protein